MSDDQDELSTLAQYSKDFLDGIIDEEEFNAAAVVHLTEMSMSSENEFTTFMKQLAKRLVYDGAGENFTSLQPEQSPEFVELLDGNIHHVIKQIAKLEATVEGDDERDTARDVVIYVCRAVSDIQTMEEEKGDGASSG